MNDLGLHGHVQRRRGLVRDEQSGIHQQRHPDAGALAHSAAELVGVVVYPRFRVGNPHAAHHVCRPGHFFAHSDFASPILDISHLRPVVVHRNLRRHGILEHHRNFFAPELPDFALVEIEDVAAAIENCTSFDVSVVGQQAHDRPDERALSRTAFADHP